VFASPFPGGTSPQVGLNPFDLRPVVPVRASDDDEVYVPTQDDLDRWNDPRVVKFRNSFRFFLAANVVVVGLAVFGDKDLIGITSLWSVVIGFKYAKLWSNDRDWRDVLHQPRHRLFGEVVSHLADGFMATFSRKHREQLRRDGRLGNKLGVSLSSKPRQLTGQMQSSTGAGMSRAPFVVSEQDLGEFAPVVRRARSDRDEIVRILGYLPPAERARVPEVENTANTLVSKIESIAISIARSVRDTGARSAAEIDAEVTQLESEANPFDTARSEARVRRLALLRRERRMVSETGRQRDEQRARLESCRLALENVRLDLVRLRTGNSSVQSVTLVAEQAMALAREVDLAVAAASEVRELTKARSSK
jgi:serine/threonine-protein kinase